MDADFVFHFVFFNSLNAERLELFYSADEQHRIERDHADKALNLPQRANQTLKRSLRSTAPQIESLKVFKNKNIVWTSASDVSKEVLNIVSEKSNDK